MVSAISSTRTCARCGPATSCFRSAIPPGAADSWEIAPDGTKYTFKIHQGITFTSGNPLTAKDVKWSFERAKNIKGNPSFLLEDIASIETPG